MLVRIAVSTVTCLIAVLSGVQGPASADDQGGGVPVFHDRVVARDPAGDVNGDGSTKVDVRKVTLDHYQTGDNGRLVFTVRFNHAVLQGTELWWGTRARPGGYSLGFESKVGGRFRLERDHRVVRRPHVRRVVRGERVIITIPWRKLGSPRKLVGLHFFANHDVGPGVDTVVRARVVLN